MILWLWLIFLGFGITLLFLGLRSDDQTTLVLGFVILWLPAFVLTGFDVPLIDDTPGIQYPTGEVNSYNQSTSYVYGNNLTGYHFDYVGSSTPPECNKNDPLCLWLFHSWEENTVTTTTQYATYSNRAYGIALLFAFVTGFWLALMNIRDTREGGEPGPRINFGWYGK